MNKHYIRIFISQILWGGTFVANELSIKSTLPFFTSFARFALSALIYWLVLVFSNKSKSLKTQEKISIKGWVALFLMGMFGITIYITLINIGLSSSTASRAALIVPTTQPLFTIILSVFLAKEIISMKTVAGLVLGFLGATLVIIGSKQALSLDELYTNLMLLGASLSFSIFNLSNRFLPKNLSTTKATAIFLAVGALFLMPLPYFFNEEINLENLMNKHFWLSLVYLIISTVFPFFWWNKAIKEIGISRTVLFIFLLPPSAVLASALVLGHKPAINELLGGAVAMSGVLLSINFNSAKRKGIKT